MTISKQFNLSEILLVGLLLKIMRQELKSSEHNWNEYFFIMKKGQSYITSINLFGIFNFPICKMIVFIFILTLIKTLSFYSVILWLNNEICLK